MNHILIPVELSGGPLDGHCAEVAKNEVDALDVHLFVRVTDEEKLRCAYRWTSKTTAKGKRWVLDFECVVSRWRNANVQLPANNEGEPNAN